VDVPGVLSIEEAAKQATARQRCFRVDYQIPTDPQNQKVAAFIRAGELGKIGLYTSRYWAAQWPDPPLETTLENRLRSLIWCNDIALGGSHHVNACIHALDAVIWLAGKRPVSATGASRIVRDNPHGDSHDLISVTYEFEDGVLWNHSGKHLNNQHAFEASALVHGTKGFAQVAYGGKASLNSFDQSYAGEVLNLYQAGAERNIAAFYQDILQENYENATVRRAVDGTLTALLSREATLRRTRLTMAQLLQENRRLEVNLRGLKA
jgi:predicted dehydrogenase